MSPLLNIIHYEHRYPKVFQPELSKIQQAYRYWILGNLPLRYFDIVLKYSGGWRGFCNLEALTVLSVTAISLK